VVLSGIFGYFLIDFSDCLVPKASSGVIARIAEHFGNKWTFVKILYYT
jgi:hypothetical protein